MTDIRIREKRPSEPTRSKTASGVVTLRTLDGKVLRLKGAPADPKKIALDLRQRQIRRLQAEVRGDKPTAKASTATKNRLAKKRQRLDALTRETRQEPPVEPLPSRAWSRH